MKKLFAFLVLLSLCCSSFHQCKAATTEEAEARKSVDEIVKSLDLENQSVYMKVLLCDKWIVEHVEYDNYEESGTIHSTAYDALKYRKALCMGFANLFQYFMDCVGVPCEYVSDLKGDHAYNMVFLNNQWYLFEPQNAYKQVHNYNRNDLTETDDAYPYLLESGKDSICYGNAFWGWGKLEEAVNQNKKIQYYKFLELAKEGDYHGFPLAKEDLYVDPNPNKKVVESPITIKFMKSTYTFNFATCKSTNRVRMLINQCKLSDLECAYEKNTYTNVTVTNTGINVGCSYEQTLENQEKTVFSQNVKMTSYFHDTASTIIKYIIPSFSQETVQSFDREGDGSYSIKKGEKIPISFDGASRKDFQVDESKSEALGKVSYDSSKGSMKMLQKGNVTVYLQSKTNKNFYMKLRFEIK